MLGFMRFEKIPALTICCLALSGPALADAAKRIDVPAGDLLAAIEMIEKQADVEIIYQPEKLKGLKTPGIRGNLSVQDAVRKLLEGTKLRLSTDAVTGAMLIVGAGETGKAKSPSGAPIASAAGVGAVQLAELQESPGGKPDSSSRQTQDGKDGIERMIVEEGRIDPLADPNVDIPRTESDTQPYYIFNAEQIERSGATNIDDFLKNRLTMNTVAQTNAQFAGSITNVANTSAIDLRGLGADQTLVLVNGRRVAGMPNISNGLPGQPDLNGIPLSAIERIEVLPSSASGIYGGSAVGGVVNVILKRDYAGAEVRASFDNSVDTDSLIRRFSATYGQALGNRTRLMLSASWADGNEMLVQDRRELFDRGIARILANAPGRISQSGIPFLGALPNIYSQDGSDLVLDGGTSIGSPTTFIPGGTSAATLPAAFRQGLSDNAGQWNFDLPAISQAPTGLYRPMQLLPKAQSMQGSVNHALSGRVQLFADFSYFENRSSRFLNTAPSTALSILGTAPGNPFENTVRISLPSAMELPNTTRSTGATLSAGAAFRLPLDWTAEFDYTRSQTRGRSHIASVNSASNQVLRADILNGTLNPFVDLLQFPLDLYRYVSFVDFSSKSILDDFALRGRGPLPALPWGTPRLAVGLEHRLGKVPQSESQSIFPLRPQSNERGIQYAREQVTDSAYLEAQVPLVREQTLPLLHALEAQMSGRRERYAADTGTSGAGINLTTGNVRYIGPTTVDGEPFFARDVYSSNDYTFGLKYQPAPGLTFRASRATAFLPLTPTQLTTTGQANGFPVSIDDPVLDESYEVILEYYGDGNPNLKPQSSRSANAGVIWEPAMAGIKGLRINVEYYRNDQFDEVGTPFWQDLVNFESVFADRVTRSPMDGRITTLNGSMINLLHRTASGWDFSVGYPVKTAFGTFNLSMMHSRILSLSRQVDINTPAAEFVGFPSDGGAAKHKGNAVLTWEQGGWIANWTAYYFGAYKQYGAEGSPNPDTGPNSVVAAQGSDSIPSQMYHDFFVGYAFGKTKRRDSWAGDLLQGLELQLIVRNAFDTLPPFDAYYASNFYISPFGDSRLRSYVITAKKQF